MGEVRDQNIDLTNGAVELTLPWTLTETTGEDITADATSVRLSLGTLAAPGAWVDPSTDGEINTGWVYAKDWKLRGGATDASPMTKLYQVTATILIGVGGLIEPLGDYWLWRYIESTPEILPKRAPLKVHLV